MADATLLRGAPLAETTRGIIAERTARLKEEGVEPRLAVVIASADPAVAKYAEAKGRTAAKLGIALDVVHVDPADGQAALERAVAGLSARADIHGILLELPVDKPLDAEAAIALIDPKKDVDGLTAINLGLIAAGREKDAIAPATPLACIRLAESATVLRGKRAAVVGRGRSVGRALIPMLINRDVTVTVCHTKTPDLAAAIGPCELVFAAAGAPGLVTGSMLRPGQIVIDAGISVVDGKVVGDVDAETAMPRVAALTPVPGGVGPLTSTLIFDNLMTAIALQRGKE
ncbi:bifunctional 5,10-methylenetetrahydrofolate dehydrogenase/5,10-methenyltetrahydrofolate cyclohydrolase [Inquilinus sp. CAU 1745]|uniref:bifunctional 5,10-methylenetetrahydrofolate dehydrogenase/5,10-methenyltetrahydrofolate cyclohydrolase n=1 Tax=Inquilinus sp. CAU 1745 TaxID=3140369 RepID=UPI00325B3987